MSGAARSPGSKVGNADTEDMFRASPWITYDPSPDARSEPLVRSNVHFYSSMSEDVDMDAPQISTLREEETPEPQPARTSKFRVKLLVNEGKRSASMGSSASQKPTQAGSEEDEDEDEEEEEDQLIDDDDDDVKPPPVVPVATPAVSTRGSPAKRGRGRGGRRRGGRGGAEILIPTAPPGSHILPDIAVPGSSMMTQVAPTGRKKAAPAKGAAAQRAIRKRPSKASKLAAPIPRDDAESVMSEAYPGTAASSPIPHEERTPEPEIPVPQVLSTMTIEDGTLEGVPLPVYPLPSKPFPVQPPPKIGTGFAPIVPLDKSGKSVRRWRQVNREVRGIAGGRWFTRTWVGEKESEFSSAQAAAQAAASHALAQAAQAAAERDASSAAAMTAAGITLPPKLAAASMASSGKAARVKGSKTDTAASTVPPSRSDSLVPESISAPIPKKRGSGFGTPTSEVPVDPPPVL